MNARTDSNAPQPANRSPRRLSLLMGKAPRTRSVVVATGLLVVALAPFGVAATGDSLREGRRNGTTVRETQIISNVNSTTALTGGYSTRQSNLSTSGGGAVYGCRSQAGGSRATPTAQNPCVRSNNLSKGLAFELNSTLGDVVGSITAGAGGDAKKPFTTNATGVATGLNADRVDNLDVAEILAAARTKTGLDADTVDGVDAADLRPRFAQVNSAGTVSESRGLLGANPVTHADTTGIYAILFSGDLGKCAISATLTGGALGEIVAVPVVAAGNTTLTVTTASSAGVPGDRAFHVSINC